MGQNICLKLSLLGNILVLDKVANVTVRSSHPGRGVSDSAPRQKNWMKQFSPPFFSQRYVICATALAWQIGKCQH